jgi:hypothetical protein
MDGRIELETEEGWTVFTLVLPAEQVPVGSIT